MTQSREILRKRLDGVRWRRLLVGAGSGVVWGAIAALVVLVLAAWLDLLWELSPANRIAALTLAAAGGAGVLAARIAKAGRAAGLAASARRLDEVARSGGLILTGLQLEGPLHEAQRTHWPELTGGLAEMAIGRAAEAADTIPLTAAVPWSPLAKSIVSLSVVTAILGCVALIMPGLFRTEWRRLLHPSDDVPPYSPIEFRVEPGNTSVVYGDELEIRAVVRGGPVEDVELVLEEAGRTPSPLPMFAEPNGRWRAALAKVTSPGAYWVRAYRSRSRRYQIRLITVPRIAGVRVRVSPPAYTRLPAVEGPLPKEGLAGLAGTSVEVRATSNRPLRGGKVVLTGKGPPSEVALEPAARGAQEVTGRFAILRPGKLQLSVEDVDGQGSREQVSATVTLLADQRPFIRLLKPPAASLATPTANLPVVLSAEDDYGLSRVQLYRSLNDSRALPMDLAIDGRSPNRSYQTVYLPLGRYGLVPGDTIKLFGRAEDNDPAGVKGSESSTATVRIISQEEFERLVQVQRGLEVLLSKYAEAQRRLAALAREIEQLQKQIASLPPESPLAEEGRRRLRQLTERLQKEASALEQLAGRRLPYDIDQRLTPELARMAELLKEGAKQLESLGAKADLSNRKAADELAALAKRLGLGRDALKKKAAEPLEYLAAVFPLIADQQRFVALAQRQRDLATRMASLRERDNEDNPALKARMRDLEEEQREIRSELDRLLDDIADHAERLPDHPKLDHLRRTARQFVAQLRVSGAAQAMSAAEATLAEFSGTLAHAKAEQAAEILERFIAKCDGMGGEAGDCLAFQPSLPGLMGNTIAQLLGQMGLGSLGAGGSGYGSGGYSASRGPGIGLYGGLSGAESMTGFEGQGARGEGSGAGAAAGGTNPDRPGRLDQPGDVASGGTGEGPVPLEYRRRVGQYFQRIAEEVKPK